MAWIKAKLLLRASRFQRVLSLDVWPDRFTPEELACLQYPREGTPAERGRAASLQRELVRLLRDAIQVEEIETTPQPVSVPVMEIRTELVTPPWRNSAWGQAGNQQPCNSGR